MNWEAVAALSTAFTGIVIAVTAIAALREVRVASEHAAATREQLEHLRKSTQFEGSLAVFSELDTPRQIEARRFVQFELADRLKDERFRNEVGLIAGADESKHKELTVLRCFERMGLYVQKGFVDPDVMYMIAAGRVLTMWRALEETWQSTAASRARFGGISSSSIRAASNGCAITACASRTWSAHKSRT